MNQATQAQETAREQLRDGSHDFDFLRGCKIHGTSMGANCFRVDMPRLLSLWRQGRLKLDHLISGKLKLEQINEGLSALKSGARCAN